VLVADINFLEESELEVVIVGFEDPVDYELVAHNVPGVVQFVDLEEGPGVQSEESLGVVVGPSKGLLHALSRLGERDVLG